MRGRPSRPPTRVPGVYDIQVALGRQLDGGLVGAQKAQAIVPVGTQIAESGRSIIADALVATPGASQLV